MSVKIMNNVWDLDIPTNEKMVLLAYADHASDDGTSIFPSQARLARKTGYSKRQIQRITDSLQRKGLLIADGTGPRGTRRWRQPAWGDKMSPVTSSSAMPARPRGDKMSPVTSSAATSAGQRGDKMSPMTNAGVTPATPGGDTDKHEGATPVSPESSLTINEPSEGARLSEVIASANRTVDDLLSPAPPQHYEHREKIPALYLPYADAYHELTGQVPTQRALHDWLADFKVWQSEGISPDHLRQAHKEAAGRFSIVRPGSLTRMAAAVKAKRSTSPRASKDPEWHRRADAWTQRSVAEGRRRAAEYYDSRGMPFEDPDSMRPLISDIPGLTHGGPEEESGPRVPMPDAIRERFRAVVKSKSVPRE